MSESTEPGVEKPVEDVLEQQRESEAEPDRDLPDGAPPDEANEADYVEQQIEVPVEDDRLPGGSA